MHLIVVFLRLVRFKDWFYFLGLPILVFLVNEQDVTFQAKLSSTVYVALYLACGYLFNNFYDQQEDSRHKNFLKSYAKETSWMIFMGMNILMMGLSIVLEVFSAFICIFLLNVLYSHPKVRLKENLIFSLLANALSFSFITYVTSKISYEELTELSWVLSGYVFLIFLPIQYIHLLEHKEDEGKSIKAHHRYLILVTMIPLLLSVFMSSNLFLDRVKWGTCLFLVASFIATQMIQTPSQCRLVVRKLGALLGIYIFLVEILK